MIEVPLVSQPSADPPPAPEGSRYIGRERMRHRWEDLTFVHWRYPPEAVQALLPEGLKVDTFEGRAWVSLVAFSLRIRAPAVAPAVPWIGSFLETNVRTYVVGPDGREGIWFFSLEAARLPAVLLARAWYRLPYVWARMRLHTAGSALVYESRRRWPRPAGQRHVLAVVPERRYAPGELSPLDEFLTARFGLWSPARGGFAYTLVDHPAWPLWHTRLLHVEDELLQAAGLPTSTAHPLVHHSPSISVRFGSRTFLRA